MDICQPRRKLFSRFSEPPTRPRPFSTPVPLCICIPPPIAIMEQVTFTHLVHIGWMLRCSTHRRHKLQSRNDMDRWWKFLTHPSLNKLILERVSMMDNSVLNKPQKHSTTNCGDKEMQSMVVGQEGPPLPPFPLPAHYSRSLSWLPASPVRDGAGRGER